jgi:hypothetical protein
VRAVRTDEWKLIRYPQINYNQLFNLKNDPLEINNLAGSPDYKTRIGEMMELLMKGAIETNDTINFFPTQVLPMNYDFTKLKQKPDAWQPEYILNKYFKETR